MFDSDCYESMEPLSANFVMPQVRQVSHPVQMTPALKFMIFHERLLQSRSGQAVVWCLMCDSVALAGQRRAILGQSCQPVKRLVCVCVLPAKKGTATFLWGLLVGVWQLEADLINAALWCVLPCACVSVHPVLGSRGRSNCFLRLCDCESLWQCNCGVMADVGYGVERNGLEW